MAYTIFTNSSPAYGNVVIGNGGSAGTYTLATTQGTYGSWTNTALTQSSGAIQVKGDAEFEGRVRINGQDLVETLETIQKRLAILVPNPKLLKKYEALQQAYDHYKTLEALCVEQNDSDTQK